MDERDLDALMAAIERIRLGQHPVSATFMRTIADAIAALRADNVCDACVGTGKPISGLPCMCGGTGRMSDAARHLREELVTARARAEQDKADAERYRWIKLHRLLDVDRSLMAPGRPFEVSGGVSVRVPIPLSASLPEMTLDAAIDAAIDRARTRGGDRG